MFTTLCMVSLAPDRRSAAIRLAGHPPPLLIAGGAIASLEPDLPAPPLGVDDGARWEAREHALPERWSLLLYTDGLIEGRIDGGAERLGAEGLAAMVRGFDVGPGLVTELVEHAEQLNGGPMLDDVAALLVQRP
jgi:serine phosphatase RsbU (regulator of sigma subunit)